MNDTTTQMAIRAPAATRDTTNVPRRLKDILCLDDFEEPVRRFLPRPIFGYISGGVETNASREANPGVTSDE